MTYNVIHSVRGPEEKRSRNVSEPPQEQKSLLKNKASKHKQISVAKIQYSMLKRHNTKKENKEKKITVVYNEDTGKKTNSNRMIFSIISTLIIVVWL